MKKIFVTMCVALFSMGAQAQDCKNEIGVFYGFDSASNIFSIVTSAISAAAGDQSSFWGPVGVEYYYHVTHPLYQRMAGRLTARSCRMDSRPWCFDRKTTRSRFYLR